MRKLRASSRHLEASSDHFDPFNNRLSRDIRNTLSEAIVEALNRVDRSPYRNTAAQWVADELDDIYVDYIQDRLKRYDQVFNNVNQNRINNPRHQALILWNQRLFFEVHEHLEQIWHKTTGDEHAALKGLIQAAGVYIHLEYNHLRAAEKLAIKSAERLQKNSGHLTFIGNLDMLLVKLKTLDEPPPQLIRAEKSHFEDPSVIHEN
jgi:hypothetical protein